MSNYYFITFALVFTLSTLSGYAQTPQEQYEQAEDLIDDGNFHKALVIYQTLLKDVPNNANLNFKVGFCYLNTATEKVKAIPYLEFAASHISDDYKSGNLFEEQAPIEALFYLGKAYHVNYRFDDAERIFFKLKNELTKDDPEFIKDIDYELASCQVARVLMKTPVDMTVTNLGPEVNSIYSEHSPVISGDEGTLIFTSKREGNTGSRMTDDGQYFEDIYISTFDGKKYSQAKQISTSINTPGHDASIGLSFDGSKLFIYRDDNGDGNIYMSIRTGDDWGVPEKMPSVIDSKYRETHASMSLDQSEIYFTSNRKGGYGGLDIYRVRRLPNGNWSKAQNLGPDINTPYDEEGPYLHPDGTSLYFASKGHNTMGGYDIFVSYVDENGKWSKPENIGYPINTPDDNIYYVPSVDGRRAYYASYANNSIGNYDIFRIDLSDAHIRNQTVISGTARNKNGVLLANALITITNSDDDVIGIYTPEPTNGKFLMILPRDKTYHVTIESANFSTYSYDIRVPEFSYDQSEKVVAFNDIIIEPKDKAVASGQELTIPIQKNTRKGNELTIPQPAVTDALTEKMNNNDSLNPAKSAEKVDQTQPENHNKQYETLAESGEDIAQRTQPESDVQQSKPGEKQSSIATKPGVLQSANPKITGWVLLLALIGIILAFYLLQKKRKE